MRKAQHYDVIVVGLGAMGSAAAYHLAQRGRQVLGVDRFTPPHALGSSHGESRIIREAYFEHPAYVPLVQRAHALWMDVERRGGAPLYLQTGGLMVGLPESDLVAGALRSAREHGLAHEVLDGAAIARRFPALHPEPGMIGVHEPRAGVLFPESCIAAHLALAQAAGARLHYDEPALRWLPHDDGVALVTPRGEYTAKQLVVSAGPWVQGLFPDLALPFTLERQVLHWLEPRPPATTFAPAQCPVHLWQFDGRQFFYGFPDLGSGVKLARHHRGAATTIDAVERTVSGSEVEDIRRLAARFVPHADGAVRRSAVCLYTNTPDEHFWIDRHPEHEQVLIVSPCSGHGFKFASVVGEIVADSIVDGASRFDLSLFRARPASPRG